MNPSEQVSEPYDLFSLVTLWYAAKDVVVHLSAMSEERHTEQFTFREVKRIAKIVRRVSKNRGMDVSSLIRQAVRIWLANGSHLTDEEKKDLGITPELTEK